MKKDHEEKYRHIEKFGFLEGLIKLPFNLIIILIGFPFAFVMAYSMWYDGCKGEYRMFFDSFLTFFYGFHKNKYHLIEKKTKKKKQ